MKFIGKVDSINWDTQGRPIKFVLSTLEGDDVILENSRYDKKLRRLIDRFVEVEGRLCEKSYGEKILRIKKIRRKESIVASHEEVLRGFPVNLPTNELEELLEA